MKARADQLGHLLAAMAALGLVESPPSGALAVFTFIVPRRAISSDALELARDLQAAQDLVKTADEYLTGRRSPVIVLQISSSDYHFDFEVAAKVGAFLAKAVSLILGWYKSILELRKSRAELAEKAVPNDVLEPIDQHIDNRTRVGVKEAIGKLFRLRIRGRCWSQERVGSRA